jgi:hypothetical protein
MKKKGKREMKHQEDLGEVLFPHVLMFVFAACIGGGVIRYHFTGSFWPLVFVVAWTSFWGYLWLRGIREDLEKRGTFLNLQSAVGFFLENCEDPELFPAIRRQPDGKSALDDLKEAFAELPREGPYRSC